LLQSLSVRSGEVDLLLKVLSERLIHDVLLLQVSLSLSLEVQLLPDGQASHDEEEEGQHETRCASRRDLLLVDNDDLVLITRIVVSLGPLTKPHHFSFFSPLLRVPK
jgi:hypothetical protein